jgi:uncharacterized protein
MWMEKCLLLIFVKKPKAGQVKTRLAATVGNEKALQIYLQLLERTREITHPLPCRKTVYYTPEIVEKDIFDTKYYQKALQGEGNLGERMQNAFEASFSQGYEKVCIIGSDCYELDTNILKEAFAKLDEKDVVIGPATDGGYYLLGMKRMCEILFHNKNWSTASVFSDTLNDLKNASLSFSLLPELTDVDEEKDLITLQHLTPKK